MLIWYPKLNWLSWLSWLSRLNQVHWVEAGATYSIPHEDPQCRPRSLTYANAEGFSREPRLKAAGEERRGGGLSTPFIQKWRKGCEVAARSPGKNCVDCLKSRNFRRKVTGNLCYSGSGGHGGWPLLLSLLPPPEGCRRGRGPADSYMHADHIDQGCSNC